MRRMLAPALLLSAAAWAAVPPPAPAPNRQPGADEANTGYARGTGVSSAVHATSSYGYPATSAVAFGHRLFATRETGVSDGWVDAYSKVTGSREWTFPLGAGLRAVGAPLCEVKDGRTLVYAVGKAAGGSWTVYCLWDKGAHVELLWRSAPEEYALRFGGFEMPWALLPGPDGRLLVTADAGGVQFGLLALSTEDGAVRFYHPVRTNGTKPSIDASLRRIYAGTDQGLHCLDADTGELRFAAGSGYVTPGAVDAATHRVYATVWIDGYSGRLTCFDGISGEALWDAQSSAGLLAGSAPVLAQGRVVCGTGPYTHARLFALDASSGELLWISGTPVYAVEDSVVTGDGHVWTLATPPDGEPWLCCTRLSDGARLFHTYDVFYTMDRKIAFDRDSLYLPSYFGDLSRFVRNP